MEEELILVQVNRVAMSSPQSAGIIFTTCGVWGVSVGVDGLVSIGMVWQ